MNKPLVTFLILSVLLSLFQVNAFSGEIVLYSFEKDPQGWEVPDWTLEKSDYVGEEVSISEFYVSDGKYSLELRADFPGGSDWRGAYAECTTGVSDWSIYDKLSADIYLPKETPHGLRARIILTVGDDWTWTEMNKSVSLVPGEWTIIKVDLSSDSLDWRRFVTDEFRKDVKKVGIRVESNGGVDYKGSIYIDNIKLSND